MSKRELPDYIEGYGQVFPYKKAIRQHDKWNKRQVNRNQESKVKTLSAAIESVNLKDGMTISFHHHLRNGDDVMAYVFKSTERKGYQRSDFKCFFYFKSA